MFMLQLFSLLSYGIIAYQDVRDREVTWIWFPFLGISLGLVHGLQVGFPVFAYAVITNLILTSGILLLLWAVTRYVLKKPFLNVSFGLGDLLFLYAMALGFPTMTYVYLLVTSLIFSLVAFIPMKLFLKVNTVPMAGLMGLFLMTITLLSILPGAPSLYAY